MNPVFRRVIVACVVAVVAFAAGAWAFAQPSVAPQPVTPVVYSGADIGFRVTQRRGETPVGELVVRINGEWKPAQFALGIRPLTK